MPLRLTVVLYLHMRLSYRAGILLLFGLLLILTCTQQPPSSAAAEPVGEPDDSHKNNNKHRKAIAGGNPADLGEYPSFAHPVGNGCGATLIRSDILLTAAHCYKRFKVGRRVCLGGTQSDCSDASEQIEIAQIYIYPDHLPSQLLHDLMLVRLAAPAGSSAASWNADPSLPAEPSPVTAVGFGQSENGQSSSVLLEVELTVADTTTCATSLVPALSLDPAVVEQAVVCAYGNVGEGTCKGDS